MHCNKSPHQADQKIRPLAKIAYELRARFDLIRQHGAGRGTRSASGSTCSSAVCQGFGQNVGIHPLWRMFAGECYRVII